MNYSSLLDSSNESYYSKHQQRDEMEGKVVVERLPNQNGIIALMDHPSSITVYHNLSINVLSGGVSVFGYEINVDSSPLKVFSSEKTGLIEVKTETFDRIWKKKRKSVALERLFHSIIQNEKKSRKLLEQFGNFTVAIHVRRCEYPINIQFLELYYPHMFEFNLYRPHARETYTVSKNKGEPLQFGLEQEELAAKISLIIRSTRVTESNAPKIIICGPSNTGKSSLIRFLINKTLSTYSAAYYLETDPGQTEFTPPGILSLTKVTKPIIGPAFYHPRTPISMVFTGSIAPTSPGVYCKSAAKLMQLYADEYSDEVLFVNTMGWMEGLGLDCLVNIIKIVEPTLLVEIVRDETSMFDYRTYIREEQYIQMRCSHDRKKSRIPSKEMRELSLLSYFGTCLSPFQGPMYINEIKPYCVSWDKIVVHVSHQKVPPNRIIEAITESIVALCAVPEPFILASDIPQFPRTLEDEADNKCFGYGLVQSVNEEEHLLNIVAPLTMDEWRQVNAIIKGNIIVPDALILNQEIYETPLPYTDDRDPCYDNDEENDGADKSLVSIQGIDEMESTAPIALASTACYRKRIHKRH